MKQTLTVCAVIVFFFALLPGDSYADTKKQKKKNAMRKKAAAAAVISGQGSGQHKQAACADQRTRSCMGNTTGLSQKRLADLKMACQQKAREYCAGSK